MAAATFEQPSLNHVLGLLLKDAGISAAKLAERINIPRATISGIVSGRTTDPRASTLEVIAKYFDVSVDQLLGKQPISSLHQKTNSANLVSIPVIAWDKASVWPQVLSGIDANTVESITVDEAAHGKFALKITEDAMWPQFQPGTTLIVDPNKTSKNRDFVIAYLESNDETVFRQLLCEGKRRILSAINPDFPSLEMQENDKILGVVIQTRSNFST